MFAGNVVTWLWPFYAVYAWPAVDILGVCGLVAIRLLNPPQAWRRLRHQTRAGLRAVLRVRLFCTNVLGHFGPRELGAFWPIYFMLFYMSPVSGSARLRRDRPRITALTLIGFFTIGEAFPLWMAFVNGGGLIVGGLWMRRI